jgi:secondary thiamine-phosphate synthase enzyme
MEIREMQRVQESALFTAFGTTGAVRTGSIDISIPTTATSELTDVTENVRAAVAEADIAEGIALVSVPHTTCAIIVNEDEPGFSHDLTRALEEIAPTDRRYAHDDAPHEGEDVAPNGYAHVRAAFLSSPSVMLPIRDGALALGRWQRIFLVELDRGRPRRVQVPLLGRSD